MALIVDGMNVIGSRPDRWWERRREAMRELVELADAYAERTGEEVTVVLDSRPFELGREPAGGRRVEVVFASARGRGAADDEIARRVAAAPDASALRVVTSDRELAARVSAHGAEVVGAGGFRRELDR